MFGGNEKKKLVIVAPEKLKKHANLMTALISENDDSGDEVIGTKDGSVEVTIWDEIQYLANQPQLSSDQDILFIGSTKKTKSALEALNYFKTFSQFGIEFYMKGNMAAIIVSQGDESAADYECFMDYCEKNNKLIKERFQIPDAQDQTQAQSRILAGSAAVALLSTPISVAGAASAFGFRKLKSLGLAKKIEDQKYSVAVQVFYLDHLANFLEN